MNGRIQKEINMITTDPGPGITAWTTDDSLRKLEAQIQGPDDSPYRNGLFLLSIYLPERYPLEPPRISFLTPVYHPNIDCDGRICMDLLKMQPQGNWSPSINLNTLLLSVRMLLASPNAQDGLVPEITEEFKRDHKLFSLKAEQHTAAHAIPRVSASDDASQRNSLNEDTSSTRKSESPVVEHSAGMNNNSSTRNDSHSDDDKGSEEDSSDEESERRPSLFEGGNPTKKLRGEG